LIATAGFVNFQSGRAVPWRVFFTCWIVYAVFWTPYIVREHFPALALMERGALDVTPYLGWTEDIFPGPKGGAYINNNPGASLTGAVPLLLLRPLLVRVDRWNRTLPRPAQAPLAANAELFDRALAEGRGLFFLLVAFLTVALAMAPATAGAAAYLCSRLIAAGLPRAGAACVALLYALGTPALFRVGHLNHNLLVCDAGLTALLLLWDPQDRPLIAGRAALAGGFAGYCVLCDYSGVVVVAVAALYAWMRSAREAPARRWQTLAAFAAGVLPGVAALAFYQAWAFGSLVRPSQHYMPPTAPTAQGYRGFSWPSPALAWANFFDPRYGLFAYCPLLLLAFLAPLARRVRYRVPRREAAVLWLYFALFVLFCAANRYSWLQPSTGFRYLAPVLPALALFAAQAAQALPRWARRLLVALACAQSLLLAASHENDVRLSWRVLRQRDFAFVWMARLRSAGVPVTWPWICLGLILALLALVLVWTAAPDRAPACENR
jgi:hypothetical protein